MSACLPWRGAAACSFHSGRRRYATMRAQLKVGLKALRAALASATSLLAILLLDGQRAAAVPVMSVDTSTPFYYQLGSTWEAGTDTPSSGDGSETYTFTPLTPSTTTDAGSASPFARVGQMVLTTLSSSETSVPALVNFHRNSSPGGAVPDGNTVFVGTANLRLVDSPLATSATASASYGYTMSPGNRGTVPLAARPAAVDDQADPGDQPAETGATAHQPALHSVVATARRPAAATDVMTPNGADAGTITMVQTVDPRPGNSRTPPDIPMPAVSIGVIVGRHASGAPAASSHVNGQPQAAPHLSNGAPTVLHASVANPKATGNSTGRSPAHGFAAPLPGGTVFSVADPSAARIIARASATTSSKPIQAAAAKAFYSMLQQSTSVAKHDRGNLTADGYKDTDTDLASFAIASDGPTVSADASVPVPIMVVGTGGGELPSSLTIFSAASAALEGGGNSLSYFFHHGIAQ